MGKTVYVALLRGVNVGGNNMISMKELRDRLAEDGLEDVSTYINSGNVLFKSASKDPRKLEKKIEAILSNDFGIGNSVVVRSLAEYEKLMKQLGKLKERDDWRYNVMFLRHAVDSKDILKKLDAKPEIEEVTYYPGTLVWAANAKTVNTSSMMKFNTKPLYKEVTVRNLNTTRKLFELMQKLADA